MSSFLRDDYVAAIAISRKVIKALFMATDDKYILVLSKFSQIKHLKNAPAAKEEGMKIYCHLISV